MQGLQSLGGAGRDAVFVPANGFPLAAYRRLLERLGTRLRLRGAVLRPMWPGAGPPDPSVQWSTLADDLLRELPDGEERSILVGHSLGATVAIYAAAAAPGRVAAVVLIEPAMVDRLVHTALRLLPYRVRQRRIGLVRSTLRRPDAWDDRAAFVRHAARNPVYRELDPEAMQDLADGLLHPRDSGVTLAYSKQWEAHFYATAPWPIPQLREVTVPVVGIRGRSSMFLSDRLWSQVRAAQPYGRFQALPEYGHLLPIEAPNACAEAVFGGLQSAGVFAR